MHLVGVFDDLQVGGARITQFIDCGRRVLKQTLLTRITPGPGNDASTAFGADFLGVGFNPGVDGLGIDQSLFDQQRLQRLDPQCRFGR